MTEKKQKRKFCLPPCPSYDVEGMERWLTEMAARGWYLAEDGFFAGVATFERGEVRKAKYRLEAVQKPTGILSDGDAPSEEQIELSAKYSWDYVGRRGDFYIYRSFDPTARELNTDPEVQALALNAVKKRRRYLLGDIIFWVLIYTFLLPPSGPLNFACFLMAAIGLGAWFFALLTALLLWLVIDEIIALRSLRKFQRRLREGTLPAEEERRSSSAAYYTKRAVKAALIVLVLVLLLVRWSNSVTDADKVQRSQYSGDIPFATIADFADAEVTDYHETMLGMRMGFNTVREWSDILAPRCMEYNEHAKVTFADGSVIDGGLYVDYFELATPALARRAVKELYRSDRHEKNFVLLDTALPEADFAAAYRAQLHFPTILLRQGNVVVRAYFYQTGPEEDKVEDAQWMACLAERLAQP